ncbi:13483_t:CDS:2 [Dentiscutata erythropus]|uniref:13483_t:CDS:1 n=1 Tax=Dentiscutata erythropus TaxID=1348616 RepID=A0A9N9D4X2_9GLOM|nr:13483_t:CDS:2 [Dentiscutata erythropus]
MNSDNNFVTSFGTISETIDFDEVATSSSILDTQNDLEDKFIALSNNFALKIFAICPYTTRIDQLFLSMDLTKPKSQNQLFIPTLKMISQIKSGLTKEISKKDQNNQTLNSNSNSDTISTELKDYDEMFSSVFNTNNIELETNKVEEIYTEVEQNLSNS